jgi:hypothetical protein
MYRTRVLYVHVYPSFCFGTQQQGLPFGVTIEYASLRRRCGPTRPSSAVVGKPSRVTPPCAHGRESGVSTTGRVDKEKRNQISAFRRWGGEKPLGDGVERNLSATVERNLSAILRWGESRRCASAILSRRMQHSQALSGATVMSAARARR